MPELRLGAWVRTQLRSQWPNLPPYRTAGEAQKSRSWTKVTSKNTNFAEELWF
jgi:hypothetical protein